MAKRLAGVAVAAVLGGCALAGWVENAQAYTYSVSAGPEYTDQTGGSGDFSLTFSTDRKGPGSFSYSYTTLYPLQYQQYGPYLTYILSGSGSGVSYFSKYVRDGRVEGFSASVSSDNADLFRSLSGSDDPSNDFAQSYTGSGSLTFEFERDDNVSPFPGMSYTTFQLYDIYFDGGRLFPNPNFGPLEIGSDTFLLSVPLPASAPLLGAALLFLGALGYTRRRHTAAQG